MESAFRQGRHLERKGVFTVKPMILVVSALALFLSACTADEGITVQNAWMRPTVQGENGAVYFILHNHSTGADELIGVSSDVAESVEIHESSMVDGTDVMQMNQVTSVFLDGGSEVAFEPGGLHVMLVRVRKELTVGENIEVALHFKSHEDILLNVSVTEFAPTGDEHSH